MSNNHAGPTLYGIANCDTVKKARAWLAAQGYDVPFHDFKKHGITAERLEHWFERENWQTLLNRRGTTWRQLPDDIKTTLNDAIAAKQLMLDKPSVIKRPVLELDDRIYTGFDVAQYETLFPKVA